MGEKRRRLNALKRNHTSCCYCDGPVETAEHCPPKIFFTGKLRPKGWEFPACEKHNVGTKSADQIMAFFIFSQILSPTPEEDKHCKKLIAALGNNHRQIIKEILMQSNDLEITMPPAMAPHIEVSYLSALVRLNKRSHRMHGIRGYRG